MAPSAAEVLPILGLISGVFDPFMGPYVELERRNMEEMLQKAVAEDQVDRCVVASGLDRERSWDRVFV